MRLVSQGDFRMKLLLIPIFCFGLAACSEHQVAGTGFMENKPAEFKVTEYSENGVTLKGWILSVDGEELGVLLFDGKPSGPVSRSTTEFLPLKAKYGEFDMVQVKNINLAAVTDTFTITLNGKYVATVSGSV